MLQTESEQSRLLLEVPDIVAEEIELEAEPEEFSNNAKAGNDPLIRPIPEKISDSLMYSSAVEPVSTQISGGMDAAGALTKLISFNGISLQNRELPLFPS